MQEMLKPGQWYWVPGGEDRYIGILSGQAELYIVKKKDDTDISRSFLLSLSKGQTVPCGGAREGMGLLVIAVEDVVLEQLSYEEMVAGMYVVALANPGAAYEKYEAELLAQQKLYDQRLSHKQVRRKALRRSAYNGLLQTLLSSWDDCVDTDIAGERPVITALKFVAQHMGIKRQRIVAYQERFKKDDDDRKIIDYILNNTELFGRRVTLEPDWEKSDQGTLLVFMDGVPMACLPVSPEAYEIYDINQGRRYKVTAETASHIGEEAYCFFRQMPDNVDSLWQWFRWAAGICWEQDYEILAFCCILLGLLPLATPLITQTVFNDIIPSYDRQALVMVIQVMLVTAMAASVITLMRSICLIRMKYHIRWAAEPALWIKLLGLPIDFFRKYNVGVLTARMQGIASISTKFSSVITNGVLNGIFGVFNVVLMFWYSPKLALLSCFIWLVFGLISFGLSYWLRKYQRRQVVAAAGVSGILVQIIDGLNKFRLGGAETRAFYMWSERFAQEWQWKRKIAWLQNFLNLVNIAQPMVLNFFVFYLIMTIFDDAVKNREALMNQADFLSFYAAMGGFGAAAAGFMSSCSSIMDMMTDLELIRPVLQAPDENGFRKPSAGELKGEIDLTDVSFRYKPDLPLALKQINLHIEPGSFVALVGSSGCGKSTLVRILLGLERPERGLVQYDGQDLNSLDVASVRRQMGVVMQQGRIMAGNILNNIIGSLPLTIDDAWQAAEMVGLAEDIRHMPMGMHTIISENGTNISGGQKQRILVARSLVGKAKILIFDEATRSMDNVTQGIVSRTMERLSATRIVVAHRLSTIRKADKIVVLDKGAIVAQGTFEELRQSCQLFGELVRRQEI